MPGVNFRNTYGFDPYGMEGGGGLLGMLQAMYQGQAGPGADLSPQMGAYGRSSDPQTTAYGQAPSTRFTVRPIDPRQRPDSEIDDGVGGLLDRLLTLHAEQGGYQPAPMNDAQTQSAPQDPNFREVSRAPMPNLPQGAIDFPNQAGDQPDSSYSPFEGGSSFDSPRTVLSNQRPLGDTYPTGYGQPILSDASPYPVRPGSKYAQAALALCAAGPAACAVGSGITAGQAILGGAAALLGGATYLRWDVGNSGRPGLTIRHVSSVFWSKALLAELPPTKPAV